MPIRWATSTARICTRFVQVIPSTAAILSVNWMLASPPTQLRLLRADVGSRTLWDTHLVVRDLSCRCKSADGNGAKALVPAGSDWLGGGWPIGRLIGLQTLQYSRGYLRCPATVGISTADVRAAKEAEGDTTASDAPRCNRRVSRSGATPDLAGQSTAYHNLAVSSKNHDDGAKPSVTPMLHGPIAPPATAPPIIGNGLPVDDDIFVIGRLPDTSVARSWQGHYVLESR